MGRLGKPMLRHRSTDCVASRDTRISDPGYNMAAPNQRTESLGSPVAGPGNRPGYNLRSTAAIGVENFMQIRLAARRKGRLCHDTIIALLNASLLNSLKVQEAKL